MIKLFPREKGRGEISKLIYGQGEEMEEEEAGVFWTKVREWGPFSCLASRVARSSQAAICGAKGRLSGAGARASRRGDRGRLSMMMGKRE